MVHAEYKTSDIVIASYLRMNKCQMLRIEKIGQKGTFVFADVPDELVRAFDLGNALVEPVSFHNAIRQLTTSVRRMD